MITIRRVPKRTKGTDCKSVSRGFESHRHLLESHKLIKDIENIVNRIRPREIYIPAPSYNQDHKAVYDACLIALRPHDVNFFVKRVLVYEQPQDLWESGREHFVPNTFTKIN